MLWIQAAQKPAEQPDVHWRVFWALQRALHQAKGRLRGRHKYLISMYPTVKASAGVLQTHSWLLAEVKQAVAKVGRWLGEAAACFAVAVGWSGFSSPHMALPCLAFCPLCLALWEYLGCIGQEGEAERWGMEEEGVCAGME